MRAKKYMKGSKIGTAKIINCSASSSAANMERIAGRTSLEKKANSRFDTRVSITVISFRMRLCDADGISAKAAIDGLVHSGVLQDDSPKFVKEVKYQQVKVGSTSEEKTVILLEEVD